MHPTISPYETFDASDGWFNLGVANDKFWLLFCDAIGRKDIETDLRFDTAPKRSALPPRATGKRASNEGRVGP